SPKLVEIGGSAVEGVYFSNHYTPDDPSKAVRDFVAVYRKAFGADPDSIAALSYDAARLVAGAIQRTGSTEGHVLRAALAHARDCAGVTGGIPFDADRNPVKPVVILKVEDGRFRYAATVGP